MQSEEDGMLLNSSMHFVCYTLNSIPYNSTFIMNLYYGSKIEAGIIA